MSAVKTALLLALVVSISAEAQSVRRRAVGRGVAAPVTQTVTLNPVKDNTLYESVTGGLSNGKGAHIFAGATNQRQPRRALLAFDVAGAIPAGSQILSARLTMNISLTISGPQPAALHAVSRDWGEGASNAGSVRDGIGVAPQPGDATWIHTFSPNARWTNAGGDFNATPDATAMTTSTGATWTSSSSLVSRVQNWLDQPATNFGWIIIVNEAQGGTAKRFDSRESPATAPALVIEFRR